MSKFLRIKCIDPDAYDKDEPIFEDNIINVDKIIRIYAVEGTKYNDDIVYYHIILDNQDSPFVGCDILPEEYERIVSKLNDDGFMI